MRRLLVRIFLLFLPSLVLMDLGSAWLYRWTMGDPFYYHAADPHRGVNRKCRGPHPVYHHGLRPNCHAAAHWGPIEYEFQSDALGFKAAAPGDVPLSSERHRILFIGDSMTEGVGMSHRESFVGRIEQALADRGVEVFNAGVTSYTPSIHLAKTRYLLEQTGFEFDELVVFLDVSDAEDEFDNYRTRPDGRVRSASSQQQAGRGIKEWFRNHSILYALPRVIKIWRQFAVVPEDLADHYLMHYPRGSWTVDEELLEAWGRAGLEMMRQRMDELLALLQRHDIALTVVVYPWPTQIYYQDLDSIQSRFWRDWSRERGVQFIDLFPTFVSDDAATNRETILRDFIPNDMHWNEAGHARVAELFLRHHVLAPPRSASSPGPP